MMMSSVKLMKNKKTWLRFALAVLLVSLNLNVSKASNFMSRASSSSNYGSIAEFIGEEEFFMESSAGVNARLLQTQYINYKTLEKGRVLEGNKYAIALNKYSRGCQIYDICRQGK